MSPVNGGLGGDPPPNPRSLQRLEAVLARIDAEHAEQRSNPWHHPDSPLTRPGYVQSRDPGTSVNWHEMEDAEFSDTVAALSAFLQWAIPRWNFTTEQFPYHCWWLHADVFEEITAWWGLWQSYLDSPHAHIADAATFHERTDMLKDRLANNYRGRCRHRHEFPPAAPAVTTPDLKSIIDASQLKDTH
jgi:hypothetical protein